MAELATVARPYAEAIFELADKADNLAGWSTTLESLARTAENSEVKALIGNPKVSPQQLIDVIAAAVRGGLSGESKSFVQAIITNGRIAALPAVYTLYEALKNERESKVEAHITTAFAIPEAELAQLVADLERRFKRKVEPVVTIDRELIGGARVVVGDEVIDGSVRGKLSTMANALASA
ncbi:MAG: F0F1 ATP synthase subunit delta [Burkholderiales bacterium]